MSIVLSASPWNGSGTRKRVPKLNGGNKKTIKSQEDTDDDNKSDDGLGFDNFTATMEDNTMRNDRINQLLNKVTDAGGGLADYKPPSDKTNTNTTSQPLANLMPSVVNKEGFSSNVKPNSIGDAHVSSYERLYDPTHILAGQKPYYAKREGDGGQDKLNYIIRILEDLQMEKTSNITEELVLYSFLGVFMIFIVDSFAKAGKYYR